MKIDYQQILKGLLETIHGISDKEYQKRVWILGQGPECDDFTETTCHFLHEGGTVLEKYKDFGISDLQYKSLKELYDAYDVFHREHFSEYEFIDTPEWAKIMGIAKEVLKIFGYTSDKI